MTPEEKIAKIAEIKVRRWRVPVYCFEFVVAKDTIDFH